MTRKQHLRIILALFIFLFALSKAKAQTELDKLPGIILQKDSLFWAAYNNCDIASFPQFFSSDVEFYHDKGGMTVGLDGISGNMKRNLCSNDSFRLRREVVEGSVKVFPLQSSGVIYGAILSGEHMFYINEKGKPEKLDGLAKFTHVWLLKDNNWKMARILSYDHGPAPQINQKKEIKLSPTVLKQFAGTYQGPITGIITVKSSQDVLILLIKENSFTLYPEAENLFFSKDRDLTFEFIKNGKGKVNKMIVREKGEIVEEANFSR